jgi:hypothetical protein
MKQLESMLEEAARELKRQRMGPYVRTKRVLTLTWGVRSLAQPARN